MVTVRLVVFAKAPQPERSIVFLNVTAEEKGLLGSEYYAANPVYPLATTLTAQGEGDLGERMARVMARVIGQHQCPVMLMGSDCPALTSASLNEAARQLTRHDAVLLPANDGGYVLIGLKSPCPGLFNDMPWSSPTVAGETLRRMAALGLRVWQGPRLQDIDEVGDLAHLPDGFLLENY